MGWYNQNWQYRKKFIIQASQINSDLTDFPIYLNLANFGDDFFAKVKNGGGDIRITKADGLTELAREIVSCDTTAKTGEVHFKADSLSASQNTEFYLYYGNASASDYAENHQYGAHNAWNANYQGVWHLNQDPAGSAPQGIDSTNNANGASSAGSMNSNDLVAGKIGKAWDFDDSDDGASVADSAVLKPTGDLTASCWIKASSVQSDNYPKPMYKPCIDAPSGKGNYLLQIDKSTKKITMRVTLGGVSKDAIGTSNIMDNNWHYICGVRSGTNLIIYVNAIAEATIGNVNGAIDTGVFPLYLGAPPSGNFAGQMAGSLDECRVSNVARSADWIAAEYNNQNDPAIFLSISVQEANPNPTETKNALFFGADF